MTLTIIFLVSLSLTFILIVYKMIEMKRGKESFVQKIFSRLDLSLERKIEWGRNTARAIEKRTILFVAEDVPRHTRNLLFHLIQFLQKKYRSLLLDSRGTRTLNGNGKTSNYLKEIEKVKTNGQHRIDEEVKERPTTYN